MGTYLQTTTEKLDVLNFHAGHEVPSPLDIVMMLEEGEAEDEPASPDGLRGVPPDALKRLLMFILPPETSPQRWAVATKRLVVLCHLAGVESVAEHSLATLAKQLDCTRAILSIHSLAIVDALNQSGTRGGKRRQSREVYRKAATAYHKRVGHNMSAAE